MLVRFLFRLFAALLMAAVIAFLIVPGLSPRTDVYIGDYSVSDDGAKLIFHAGVMSSIGHIRCCSDSQSADGSKHYLNFYPTFGGPNSALGETVVFTLGLADNADGIYVLDNGGQYALALAKDTETGEWFRPSERWGGDDS